MDITYFHVIIISTSVNPMPNAQVKGEQHLPKHMG